MKYLCLIYSDETQWPKLPKADLDTMMSEYGAFTEGIKTSGHYIGGNRLQPTTTASTVRIRNEEVLDAYLFGSLDDVLVETERWLTIYNTRRPHDSLGRVPPLTFLPRSHRPAQSSYERSA